MKLKDEYEFVCPRCWEINVAEPSLSMRLGHNSGYTSCCACNEYVFIEIVDNDYMLATQYDKRLRVLKETIKQEIL